MKSLLLSLLCVCLFSVANAQKTLPEIKVGTIMYATAYVNGSDIPVELSIKSLSAPLSIGWSVEGYGDGSFEMSEKAAESAMNISASGQPALGVTKLGDNETFGVISRTAYKTLAASQTFTYSGIKYKVKTPDTTPFKLGSKEIDVTHVVSEDGKVELWILNNPALPLILNSSGLDTDISISEIK
jgi:hypothetical protein